MDHNTQSRAAVPASSWSPMAIIMNQVPGIECVMLIDRDGSVLMYHHRDDEDMQNAQSQAQTGMSIPIVSSTLSTSLNSALAALLIDQSSKLRLGKTKSIIGCFGSSTLVLLNTPGLITAFVADQNASVSSILELEPQCAVVTKELASES